MRVRAAVGEFGATPRAQIADARRALAHAREARDYAGIRSFGLRLRYLLEIAGEHRVQLPPDEARGDASADGG
jgi:hypothetical protein